MTKFEFLEPLIKTEIFSNLIFKINLIPKKLRISVLTILIGLCFISFFKVLKVYTQTNGYQLTYARINKITPLNATWDAYEWNFYYQIGQKTYESTVIMQSPPEMNQETPIFLNTKNPSNVILAEKRFLNLRIKLAQFIILVFITSIYFLIAFKFRKLNE